MAQLLSGWSRSATRNMPGNTGDYEMRRTILSLFVLGAVLTSSAFAVGQDLMKIKITTDNAVLTATLLDNPTSRDLVSLLPTTLILKDYAGTEKISDLPRKLSTEGAPSGRDPSVGDIALYAPWGNLALYYRDFGYSSGLIILGKIDSGIDKLSQINGKVTIERIQ
jgi:hypothetical protein